jgi:hypothetical protein
MEWRDGGIDYGVREIDNDVADEVYREELKKLAK